MPTLPCCMHTTQRISSASSITPARLPTIAISSALAINSSRRRSQTEKSSWGRPRDSRCSAYCIDLFSNAKGAEDPAQQLIGAVSPDDLAQRLLRSPELLGHELGCAARLQLPPRLGQMRFN